MHILVSNDDGYQAPGLLCLAAALKELAEITVVAPDRDRSGASNSLSLKNPLYVTRHDNGFHSVEGTPTDCVHLAITGLLEREPDMVEALCAFIAEHRVSDRVLVASAQDDLTRRFRALRDGRGLSVVTSPGVGSMNQRPRARASMAAIPAYQLSRGVPRWRILASGLAGGASQCSSKAVLVVRCCSAWRKRKSASTMSSRAMGSTTDRWHSVISKSPIAPRNPGPPTTTPRATSSRAR